MNIERGEYFVVTRGFAFNMSAFSLMGPFGPHSASQKEPEQRYDRSDEGKIFKALEVCGPMIAAECVYAEGYKRDSVGQRRSLNTTEVEVWPVTAEYAEPLIASLAEVSRTV